MTLADYRKRTAEAEQPEEEHAEHHPGALEYAQIGVVLAIITAIEIALYYIDLGETLLVTILIVLSAAKFLFVVLWFMHLKFDNRLFSTFFTGGFLLAFSIFVVVLATLGGSLV